MTTNNHTPHSTTAKLPATGATLNAPLGEIDSAIGDRATLATSNKGSLVEAANELKVSIDNAVTMASGIVATQVNGAVAAAALTIDVDDATGFVEGAAIVYISTANNIDYRVIQSIVGNTLTVDAGVADGIADNALLTMVTLDQYNSIGSHTSMSARLDVMQSTPYAMHLNQTASSGQNQIVLRQANAYLYQGQRLTLSPNNPANEELVEVASISNETVTLTANLVNAHSPDSAVLPVEDTHQSTNVIDIRSHGWVPGTDLATALQAAINAAPDFDDFGGSRPYRSTIIHIPYLLPSVADSKLTVNTQIEIPATKSIVISGGHGRGSLGLEWTGVGDYAFIIRAGQRPVRFCNIHFKDGGVEIEGNVRKDIGFVDCAFKDTPNYAVRTLGESIVEVWFYNVFFGECAGAVAVDHRNCDQFIYEKCTFLSSTAADVRLRSSGQHFIHCDWEVRPVLQKTEPFVLIDHDGTGTHVGGLDIRFTNCRFGAEADPPQHIIQAGPTGGGTFTINEVIFNACYFAGAQSNTPTADAAHAVVLAESAIENWQFVGCYFNAYQHFVKENLTNFVSPGSTRNNLFIGPTMPGTVSQFTKGGVGWQVITDDYTKERPESTVLNTNLCYSSNNFGATWTGSGTQLVSDETAPDGTVNDAWTMTRQATGNSNVNISVPHLNQTQNVIFSVWAKSDATDTMRLGIQQTDGNREWLNVIKLTSEWKRYWIEALPTQAGNLTYSIYVGEENDPASGSIIIWGVQIEHGFGGPREYVGNTQAAATRATRQFQDMVLGGRVIGYGSAAPTSGQYEAQDIVFDTSPTAGEPIGWICTISGNPGTWEKFGTILDDGGLHVRSGEQSLVVGADNSAETLTDATLKTARVAVPHYTNAEENALMLLGSVNSGVSTLTVGGGSGLNNAFSIIAFNTATDSTTLTGTERMRITNGGRVGIATNNPTSLFDVDDDRIRVRQLHTPSGETDAGQQGDIAWDTNHIYVCRATNTWNRLPFPSWFGEFRVDNDFRVDNGWVLLGVSQNAFISSGSGNALRSYFAVDTEASAATDDLTDIDNGEEGKILYLRAFDSARTVVVKHNSGTGTSNIILKGAADVSLTDINQVLHFIHNGAAWIEV